MIFEPGRRRTLAVWIDVLGGQASEEVAISREIADRVVREILRRDAIGNNGFRPMSEDLAALDGEEVLPGLIYRYPQLSSEDKAVVLTLYLGLGEVGVAMWEQELRVLQRIGQFSHPSLPELAGGGRIDAGQVPGVGAASGYVRTRGYDSGISDGVDMIARYFQSHRDEALRHFRLLADALSMLHDCHIVHRNLWPGTLEVEPDPDRGGDRYRIRLARFEMSSMISNLLRGRQVDSSGVDRVRALYAAQHDGFRVYAPPERLRFLSSSVDAADLGGAPGDVFSLAMICAEWLLGPDLLANAPAEPRALVEFQERVRVRVRVDPALPKALADLLSAMLDPVPRARPEMHSVMSTISKNYETMLNKLRPSEVTRPFLVAFLPGKDMDLFRTWGAIRDPSGTPEGQEQLATLIATDLQGAIVARSPDGATPYIRNADVDVRVRTKNVFFGAKYVWFAHTLYREGMAGMRHFERIQVVKYVLPIGRMTVRLSQLRAESLALRLHAVDAINGRADVAVLERQSKDRPDWDSLLSHVSDESGLTQASRDYLDALDWYSDYQAAQLRAREYAFRRDDDGAEVQDPLSGIALRWDRDMETGRAHHLDPMCTLMIKSSSRPGMGDFFVEEASRQPTDIKIEVYTDRGGVGDRVGVYPLVKQRGQATVVLNGTEGAPIPSRGWLRVFSDGGTQHNLRNQASARSELSRNPMLLNQLVKPTRSAGRAAPKWAGGDLLGEGRIAVRTMLETEPMFALQGPPGTGKTEVTSQAIADYLAADPLGRVLVSAQSHYVLDNLARRVLQKIGALDGKDRPTPSNWIALRAASDTALKNSVNPVIKPFTEDTYVPELIATIERRLKTEWRGAHRTDNPRIAAILAQWRAALRRSDIELRMRVRRSANLVFSSTGGATVRRLVELGSDEPFDWVLVEEAAKAWPNELVLPLVRGLRWTMVGDQAQIGAYERATVERFLESCHDDPDPQVAEWWRKKSVFLDAFDTFARIFGDRGSDDVRMELTEQRRMRKPIAEMVSAGFYADRAAGGLKTERPDEDHGVIEPAWLRGQALVWLDTGETQQAADYWTNEIEARLVAKLVRSLRFAPGPAGWQRADRLAIITPYRKQNTLIGELVPEATKFIWTVDSFQGREADIVLVSLVRDRDDEREEPYAALGHVADHRRANVLLSRARDLLVIVGRLARYENCGVPAWERAVAAAKSGGRVVDMRNWSAR